ncbi:MAG: cupin domain-containing protein [Methanobacteriaceae archaeon]|nr:cupin domain-containing protein [Methanobacteriaceae archaeon]
MTGEIGENIKKMREMKKLSIEDLSEKSGVNKNQIKTIEEGGLIPSLTPLMKIAHALGVRLGTFMDDNLEDKPCHVKNGQTNKVIRFSGKTDNVDNSNLDFHPLGATKIDRNMEPFLIEFKPNNDEHPLNDHEGEEFIYVLEGELELTYGKETYQLNKGDSIYYDSIVPHDLHNNGDKKAKILAVVYAPL